MPMEHVSVLWSICRLLVSHAICGVFAPCGGTANGDNVKIVFDLDDQQDGARGIDFSNCCFDAISH